MNYEQRTANSWPLRLNAFSLVELMIVVAILGILAAIAMPVFQGHIQKAKESAAKDNLRILRNAIELYAAQHNDVPPGYLNNNPSVTPTSLMVLAQLNKKYMNAMPKNPFNNLSSIYVLRTAGSFPATPTDATGWIYQPATKQIRINTSGTDSEGILYYDY